MEDQIEKVYWKIAEVAEMINVNPSCLRFWEDEFEWINPKRNHANKRQFTEYDIIELNNIDLLINKLGMTLEGVSKAHKCGYDTSLLAIIKMQIEHEYFFKKTLRT